MFFLQKGGKPAKGLPKTERDPKKERSPPEYRHGQTTGGRGWHTVFRHLWQNQQQTITHDDPLQFYMHLTVKGQATKALLDTGATCSTILQKLKIHSTPTVIHYGNKSTQTSHYVTDMDWETDSISARTRLQIIQEQNEPVILGMDWLKTSGCYLDPVDNTLVQKSTQNSARSRQKDHIPILEEFKHLTPQDGKQTAISSEYCHKINTGDADPIIARDYRRSPKENEAIQKEIQEMLTKKVIKPSISPWRSLVVHSKKCYISSTYHEIIFNGYFNAH